jgi:hypothetical protein
MLAYLIIGSLASDHKFMGRIFSTRYVINSSKIFVIASELSKAQESPEAFFMIS